MATDWLPRNTSSRLEMARNWVSLLDGGGINAGIPDADMNAFEAQYESARGYFDDSKSSRRGPVTTAALRGAMAELVAMMRRIKRDYLDRSTISDVDRAKLGLRPHDTTPTPQPVPTSVPEIEAGTAVIRELRFRLRDFGARRWARPAGTRGFELVWGIHDARPAHIGVLTNLVAASRSPVLLSFDEADRGKRVFFAARWVNNTFQTGPWSDIESAVIP